MPAASTRSAPRHNAAKHAFFYLTSFFALALTATAVGTLGFQIINYYFPQPEAYLDFSQSAIRFGLSTLIVAAPVFFFVTRVITRSLSLKDLDADSGVRRWLTYLVMFVALAVTAGDLITVFNYFLNGELTVRFLFKAATLLFITGSIFLYYFLDMRSDSDAERRGKLKAFTLLYLLAVIVPFVWTLFIMEPPAEARARQIDERTIGSLQEARSAIDAFYLQNERLPASFDEITAPQYPVPDAQWLAEHGFGYRATGGQNFELCAEFQRDNQSGSASDDPYRLDRDWPHPQGRHCFALEVTDIGQAMREKGLPLPEVPSVPSTTPPGISEGVVEAVPIL